MLRWLLCPRPWSAVARRRFPFSQHRFSPALYPTFHLIPFTLQAFSQQLAPRISFFSSHSPFLYREEQLSTAAELLPRFVDRRSNSALHHPGISFRWEPPARVLNFLSYCRRRRALARPSQDKRASNSRPPRSFIAALCRSNALLHHTGKLFAAGISDRVRVIALPFERQQLSPLAGFEPATDDPM
jgi:hypothetical protein